MTRPHVMEEPMRVIASEYMLFFGSEGFYTYIWILGGTIYFIQIGTYIYIENVVYKII